MDLGATLCRTSRPLCLVCPLLDVCHTSRSGSLMPRARHARPQPPFRASSRYFRGRIVDILRNLPAGESICAPDLAGLLDAHDVSRLDQLVDRLANDGLIVRDGERLRLPT
jgi:A/G-specific adenine glycosylase